MTKWQKKEIDYLKKFYSKLSSDEIAKKLNRSIDEIYLTAWRHNLKKSKVYNSKMYSANAKMKKNTWTDQQIELLTNNFIKLSFKDLSLLIGKSWQCCQKKAKKLNLNKYMKGF